MTKAGAKAGGKGGAKGWSQMALALPKPERACVNSPLELAESMGGEHCQQRVDTKAFTGRGNLARLRHLERQVDSLEQSMRAYVSATKQVAGHWMYLELHAHQDGTRFVRWRDRLTRKHLNWEAAAQTLGDKAPDVVAWYLNVTEQAKALNAEHKECRRAAAVLRQTVLDAPRPVYARPIQAATRPASPDGKRG